MKDCLISFLFFLHFSLILGIDPLGLDLAWPFRGLNWLFEGLCGVSPLWLNCNCHVSRFSVTSTHVLQFSTHSSCSLWRVCSLALPMQWGAPHKCLAPEIGTVLPSREPGQTWGSLCVILFSLGLRSHAAWGPMTKNSHIIHLIQLHHYLGEFMFITPLWQSQSYFWSPELTLACCVILVKLIHLLRFSSFIYKWGA